jgi:hypothetical protein
VRHDDRTIMALARPLPTIAGNYYDPRRPQDRIRCGPIATVGAGLSGRGAQGQQGLKNINRSRP